MIGVPGAGKTTVMREALADLDRHPVRTPFAHEVLVDGEGRQVGAHLGTDRYPFGGTDTLGMAVQPRVLSWLADGPPFPLVVGEGDRLANASFFNMARLLAYVVVVYLHCPLEVAEQRRAHRSSTRQNPSWVAGRVTKVTRLADTADHVLDATEAPSTVGARLRDVMLEEVPA